MAGPRARETRAPPPDPSRRAALLAAPALAALLVAGPRPGAAADAPVLLVVDGAVDPPPGLARGDGAAHVDLAFLESLPRAAVRTSTPWADGVQEFEGARLSDLLDAVGARGYRVRADALDDYRADLDPQEVRRYPIIVAWLHGGEPMTVRTLGPLRIILPFDDHPALATAIGHARAVWQLTRLTVLEE